MPDEHDPMLLDLAGHLFCAQAEDTVMRPVHSAAQKSRKKYIIELYIIIITATLIVNTVPCDAGWLGHRSMLQLCVPKPPAFLEERIQPHTAGK